MSNEGNKFKTWIVWGHIDAQAFRAGDYREAHNEPREYAFKTQAEMDAFLLGVDLATGYMDHEVLTEAELRLYERSRKLRDESKVTTVVSETPALTRSEYQVVLEGTIYHYVVYTDPVKDRIEDSWLEDCNGDVTTDDNLLDAAEAVVAAYNNKQPCQTKQ